MKKLFIFLLIVTSLFYFTKCTLDVSVSNPESFEKRGIDLSHHNKVTNWDSVAKTIDFVIIKATEGSTFKDPCFKSYWRNAKKHNIIRGAYHFFKPGVPGDEQFENFKNTVNLSQGDFVPVLDVENKEADINEVNKWLELAEKHYGVKPILYTEYLFFKVLLEGDVKVDRLWIYLDESYKLRPSFDNYDCVFWQYSHVGNVEGIDGPVDLDTFLCDEKKYQELMIK